jgi:hypothetical protein
VTTPAWWPPDVGYCLREAAPEGKLGALLAVVAVFEFDGETRITTARRGERRKWIFETFGVTAAQVGLIKPDGTQG